MPTKKKERTIDDFLPPNPKKTLRRRAGIVAGLLLLLFAIGLGYTRIGMDAAMVKKQLDGLAEQLRADGLKEGRHVELTYGDITMEGGVVDRHAVVNDVKLLLKPEHGTPGTVERPNSLLITTPSLTIHTGMQSVTLSLPNPVDVSSEEAPSRPMLQVSANAPIAVEITQKKIEDVLYVEWHPTLPSEIRATYLKEKQVAGEEDETPSVVPVYQTLIFTSGALELNALLASDERGLGHATINANKLSIMHEGMPEGEITVDAVRGEWSKQLTDSGAIDMQANVNIGNVNAAPELIAYAPLSFTLDASQHGSMPAPGKTSVEPASYQLKAFHLQAKDAEVNATADFASDTGEMLPVGKANLVVRNLPLVLSELKRLRLIGEENDALLSLVIERVAGKPFAEVQDINVAINRPKGGAFTIGKSTFEELVSIVLANKLQQFNGDSGGVVAPPKPTPAPIVDEHGFKG